MDATIILATLQYLTERIAAKLRQQELIARRVGVKIRYSDFTQHQHTATLEHPTDTAAELFQAVQQQVERIPFRRQRVRHVGVQVSQLQWRNWQLRLFDDHQREELLEAAVDTIRRKFGFMAILPADTLELRKRYRMDKSGYILHSPALTK